MSDAASVVDESSDDDDNEKDRDDETAYETTVIAALDDGLTQLTLVAYGRVDGNVALIPSESFAANASARRMANEIVVRALAMFHAMLAVISFRTNFVALGSHPSVGAAALSIIGPTSAIMKASTPLGACNTPSISRARYGAVISLPAR